MTFFGGWERVKFKSYIFVPTSVLKLGYNHYLFSHCEQHFCGTAELWKGQVQPFGLHVLSFILQCSYCLFIIIHYALTSCVFFVSDFNLASRICISEIREHLDCSRFVFLELFSCCADFLSLSPVRNKPCTLTSSLLCLSCEPHNPIVMA